MDTGKMWWKTMINPHRFINDISESVLDDKSVIVNLPDNLPWEQEFMDELAENLEQSTKTIRNSDVSSVGNAGEFLLGKFCSKQQKDEYWAPRQTPEEFLATNPVLTLNHQIVILDGISDKNAAMWEKSVSRYMSSCDEQKEHGVFVLLSKANKPIKSLNPGLQSFSCSEYVNGYDNLMLCLTIVSDLKISDWKKQYIAEAANLISGGNCELAGTLAEKGEQLIMSDFPDISELLKGKSNESFSELFEKFKAAMWEAQIKIVFPIVERFRKKFIRKYDNSIKHYLKINNKIEGKIIKSPDELEIGHIYHMCGEHKFAEKVDFDMVCKMRDARNSISHWNPISYKELKEIAEFDN